MSAMIVQRIVELIVRLKREARDTGDAKLWGMADDLYFLLLGRVIE